MTAYITYKWVKDKSYLLPDLDKYNGIFSDEILTEEDLVGLGFIPQDLPVLWGDSITKKLCFISEDDKDYVYGPDDLVHYQSKDMDGDDDIDEMDTEVAKSILMTKTHTMVNSIAMFKKSLYNFNIQDVDGIKNILQSLPIMDPDIVKELAGQIWPGSDVDAADPVHLKHEIKGYLLDHLSSLNA